MKKEEKNVSSSQKQTKYSFEEKWKSSANYQTGGLSAFDTDTVRWIHTRNGFTGIEEFASYLEQYGSILDAGCGNGRILGLLHDLLGKEHNLFGVDLAAAGVAHINLGSKGIQIFQGDLTDKGTLEQIPQPDFIYCQEVLHHTSDPSGSFANLAGLLAPGGELAIYVYKKKAPVREFTDDFVRTLISDMSHDEAMELTKDFAEFGKALNNVNVSVEVPDLRLLGIEAGSYPIQRLLYHFFVKCYWNPELSDEDNNMINFDWYHPSLCSRHTLEEVLDWFSTNELEVVHSYVDEYGITVRGKKAP
jgi:SAM-dependent methyltransferase